MEGLTRTSRAVITSLASLRRIGPNTSTGAVPAVHPQSAARTRLGVKCQSLTKRVREKGLDWYREWANRIVLQCRRKKKDG
jgi:hypothetical protein